MLPQLRIVSDIDSRKPLNLALQAKLHEMIVYIAPTVRSIIQVYAINLVRKLIKPGSKLSIFIKKHSSPNSEIVMKRHGIGHLDSIHRPFIPITLGKKALIPCLITKS